MSKSDTDAPVCSEEMEAAGLEPARDCAPTGLANQPLHQLEYASTETDKHTPMLQKHKERRAIPYVPELELLRPDS